MNGRAPAMGGFAGNAFLELPLLHKARDGRYVVALDFYPRSKTDTLKFLRCTDSLAAIENAILQWRADDLEEAAAEEGLVLAKVRTTEEFLNEAQYTEVLSTMPLITVEKIGESEPMPFKKDGTESSGWDPRVRNGACDCGRGAGPGPRHVRRGCAQHLAAQRHRGRGLRLGCTGRDALHHPGQLHGGSRQVRQPAEGMPTSSSLTSARVIWNVTV